jgi:hypothetical protein
MASYNLQENGIKESIPRYAASWREDHPSPIVDGGSKLELLERLERGELWPGYVNPIFAVFPLIWGHLAYSRRGEQNKYYVVH